MSLPTNTLREMTELIVDCPHFTPDWTDSGFIVLRNQNIRDGKLDLGNPSYTHKEDFDRRNRRAKPQVGDIVFTREAPMGEVCMIPKGLDCCMGQRQVLLRPRNDIDGRYLFYALRSAFVRRQILWNEGTGSTVSNVRIPVLEALKIPRHGVVESRIADILGALDAKIGVNTAATKTLEQMARVMFKDWFVTFGPTKAKIEGRAAYLAPEVWELFPDKLEYSGIPRGWHSDPLLDHASLISGGTPKTIEPAYWGGSVLWASAKDVSQCEGLFLLNTERYITERGLRESATRIVPKFATVIVARGATTGRFCMFGRDMAMNQTCYGLATKGGRPFWLNCVFANLVASLVHAAHGSVFDTITTKTIERATAIVPEKEVLLDQFEKLTSPMFLNLLKIIEETNSLTSIRDLLLPKLMLGNLRFRDAEKLVGQVA